MTENEQLPWRRISNFLLESECSDNPYEFCRKTLENMERLIPYDAAGLFFVDPSGEQVEKMDSIGLDPQNTSDYLNYYRPLDCFKPLLWQSGTNGHIDWREYQNIEFVADFINPQKIRFTSGLLLFDHYNSRIAVLTLHRAKGQGYRNHELNIFGVIQPHLTNLFSLISKINASTENSFYHAELVRDCKLLSKREAEVAFLLCQRLTAQEIATKLFISRRTVEFHKANIYEKLHSKNRWDLLRKLSGDTCEG